MVNNVKQSVLIALWFVFLTFPLLVVKVNTLKNIVEWRWINMLWVAVGAFALSFVWRWAMAQRQLKSKKAELGEEELAQPGFGQRLLEDPKIFKPVLAVLALVTLVFPLVVDIYQTNIMVLALIFVVLGLGLNVTVGLAGLLDLGYVAFFAVGAYTYGVLNSFYGFGFWISLPIGGLWELCSESLWGSRFCACVVIIWQS